MVGDVRQDGLDQGVYPEIEVPFSQSTPLGMTLVIRTDSDPAALVRPVHQVVRELDGSVPVFDVQTLAAAVADSVATRRFGAWLLGVFAGVALALASCGLYGLVAYRVARSRQEIGVRVALGAAPHAIVRLVVLRGMRSAVVGLACGLPAAWILSEYLRSLLFAVVPHDAVAFAGGALLLVLTCLLACYIPAHRAARVDPLAALRAE